MSKVKIYLIVQTVVCVALVLMLCGAAVSIYREGLERRAEDPMAAIYSREVVAERLAPVMPLFCVGVGLALAGWILGVRDEGAEKPARGVKMSRKADVMGARALNAVRAVIIVGAAALILAGIANGGARDVLYKAITICTECVGLG